MKYLSLAGMGPQDDSNLPVDRTRSIFELIDESKFIFLVTVDYLTQQGGVIAGNAEFANMENLSVPQRHNFSEQYSELSAKTMQIKINEKVHVMFHINDKVFTRESKATVDELEAFEKWSRCNCCGENEVKFKKLKHW